MLAFHYLSKSLIPSNRLILGSYIMLFRSMLFVSRHETDSHKAFFFVSFGTDALVLWLRDNGTVL